MLLRLLSICKDDAVYIYYVPSPCNMSCNHHVIYDRYSLVWLKVWVHHSWLADTWASDSLLVGQWATHSWLDGQWTTHSGLSDWLVNYSLLIGLSIGLWLIIDWPVTSWSICSRFADQWVTYSWPFGLLTPDRFRQQANLLSAVITSYQQIGTLAFVVCTLNWCIFTGDIPLWRHLYYC